MRLTLLHNPSSGDEDHDRGQLESMLVEAGHTVGYRSLADEDWREALEDDVDLIAVAGGDGSVRKVLTAIGSSPILALLLPVGSANNIARTLDLDFDTARDLLVQGRRRRRRPFDVWDVESTWGRSRCVESVGGGLFAEVLSEAIKSDVEPSGPEKVDFGLELLERTLDRAEALRWTVEIDEVRAEEELLGIEAMNIREIGANLPFAPDADSGDGLIDVVLVRPDDRQDLMSYVRARLCDEIVPPPALEARRGRRLVFEPPPCVRLHVDDVLPPWDQTTTNRVEVTRADVRLEVVVDGDLV